MATPVKIDALQCSDAEKNALITYLANQGVQGAQYQCFQIPNVAPPQWYFLGTGEDIALAAEALKTLSP